ncbi:ParA family protein, partial [Streptomyces sp. TRM76130]|nr:ParA family protein [Streptomyces sp. TRM76130]
MPAGPGGPGRFEAVGSVAVRTFTAHQSPQVTQTAHPKMDGQHVNAMAGDGSGAPRNHFADYDELPQGHFYDPDAEYEPDPEYAATLAPDAARQRRERVGPTGRPLPY